MTKQGSIVRWDAARAFGFIRSAHSAGDVFFHIRDYRGTAPPGEGLAVVFDEIHVGGKGPRATAVRAASDPQSAGGVRSQGNASERTQASGRATRPTPVRNAGQHRGRPPAPAAGASLAYGLMAGWAGLLGWGIWTQRLPLWVLAAVAALNVVTLWRYAADKNAARAGRRRIPESHLHLMALLGGWPAAWLAQRNMRHKTSKTQFRAVYWLTIVLHCGVLAWRVLAKTAWRLPL